MSTNPFNSLEQPLIRKAQFILPNERIYTLEFDNNIQMQELKLMIQKAAHLKRRNFHLFSNGEEYTQYNTEIFGSLFPNQDLVIFTLELGKDDDNILENELILQTNSACNLHPDKFLLYYCFTCGNSICSDCFNIGTHKNHIIQDKCFYLLPSKYLVDKIFINWSQKPYEDFNISEDLSEFKKKMNSIMFQELFNMLKKIQEKCNKLIDEYNQVNITSLNNIRNSVRDIKISCIKILDELKDEIGIKNIIKNEDIFIEFDKIYKELGKTQNEQFQKNLNNFNELNKNISILVQNLIKQIYSNIYKTLNDMLIDNQYENIQNQINNKLIKPYEEINNNIIKKKRNTIINTTNNINNNNFAKAIAASVQKKLNSFPGQNKENIQEMKTIINPFISSQQDIDININQNNKTEIINPFQVKFGYNNITVPNNLPNNVDKVSFGIEKEPKKELTQIKINISKDESNINNINDTSQISNTNIINQTQQPIYKTIETQTIINSNIIPDNNNNNFETIKYIQSINNNIIQSENELRLKTDIKKYLNTKYILSPISQTNSIKIITSNIKEESTLPVKFPENFGFNTFLLDCAHCFCELNNCLYVSGGIESTTEKNKSNVLLCIDITQKDELKVKKMANMNIARNGHSMISEDKYIYIIGGEDNNTVERYDIENDIWDILPSMISKRMYPILYINNGYLYAFFGKFKNGEYPCSIERLNLNNNNENIKPAWEMILFSNPKNIDVRIYGSAVLDYNGMLYFFGGNVNGINTNKIFFYNFERRIIEKEEETELTWYESFRENKLHQIGEKVVQCSDNKYFGVYITIQEQD
jgi:hypothetical protein